MALNITEAIARIKSDVVHLLTPDSIRTICRRVGHSWRERLLDPFTTVHLFMLQVLHRNTACANVPHLGRVNCTDEAYEHCGASRAQQQHRNLGERQAHRRGEFKQQAGRGLGCRQEPNHRPMAGGYHRCSNRRPLGRWQVPADLRLLPSPATVGDDRIVGLVAKPATANFTGFC